MHIYCSPLSLRVYVLPLFNKSKHVFIADKIAVWTHYSPVHAPGRSTLASQEGPSFNLTKTH